jgi:hypothetical protein
MVTLAAQLIGCSTKRESPFKTPSFITEKRIQWESYRDSINGDYQFTYNNFGDSTGTQVEYFVRVKDNKIEYIENLPDPYRYKTMDEHFDEILEILNDQSCTLTVSFDEELPIIKNYEAICNEQASSVTIKNFQPTSSEF